MQFNWKKSGLVLAVAGAFVAGSGVAVVAQDTRHEVDPAQESTTRRDTDAVEANDLSDAQLDELQAEGGSLEDLVNTAAIDGTFTSGRGSYQPRTSQCVLFDTRGGPRMAGNSTDTFSLSDPTSQGGESGCSVPSSAIAAHVNLIAISPAGAGNLKIFGASLATEPDGGIVNFQALNPNMNNANAFVMDNDPSGWTVRANGAAVHVRAVLLGYFYDGGASYAAASHDHGVVQATGSTFHVGTTTPATTRTVEMSLADECSPFFTESHAALVTYSGYVFPHAGDAELNIELWVDGTQQVAADTPFSIQDPEGDDRIPVSRTYLVEDLGSGSHDFSVRAHKSLDASPAVDLDADIVVEHRGWSCDFVIFPPTAD